MPDLQYEVATVSAQLLATKLWGWNVTETAGATAEVQIRDGGAGGAIVWDHKLNAGQSATISLPFPVALVVGGAYWNVVSGTVRGATYGIQAPR